MIETPQLERAKRFLDLHRGPRILLLANAWDAASARLFAAEGLPAIATTSAGVAFSLGLLRRITRELQDSGTYRALTEGALSYSEANELLARS